MSDPMEHLSESEPTVGIYIESDSDEALEFDPATPPVIFSKAELEELSEVDVSTEDIVTFKNMLITFINGRNFVNSNLFSLAHDPKTLEGYVENFQTPTAIQQPINGDSSYYFDNTSVILGSALQMCGYDVKFIQSDATSTDGSITPAISYAIHESEPLAEIFTLRQGDSDELHPDDPPTFDDRSEDDSLLGDLDCFDDPTIDLILSTGAETQLKDVSPHIEIGEQAVYKQRAWLTQALITSLQLLATNREEADTSAFAPLINQIGKLKKQGISFLDYEELVGIMVNRINWTVLWEQFPAPLVKGEFENE